jgi:glutamine synthetase
VIKKEDYENRLDLHQTGTALYGALPPRNQQMSDHYYGKVNDKIFNILNEAENTLLKLGVPIKTKHKEVAVNQYEISCFYAEASTSV